MQQAKKKLIFLGLRLRKIASCFQRFYLSVPQKYNNFP